MSVRVSAAVWDRSAHAGTELLMLLALADFSDDQGNSYPAVPTLAAKCRMSVRNAGYILKALEGSGELEVRPKEGPKGTNRYRIVLSALGQGLQPAAGSTLQPIAGEGVQPIAGVTLQPIAPLQPVAPLQPIADHPAIQRRLPLQPIADKPSLNRQEPSDRSVSQAKRDVPPCPVDEIVSLYHQHLPELPRVKLIDAKGRRKALGTFWAWVFTAKRTDGSPRATTTDEGLAWFRGYWALAARNDFIAGRTPPGAGHQGWRADFDYLLTERGRIQVIEKTREAA